MNVMSILRLKEYWLTTGTALGSSAGIFPHQTVALWKIYICFLTIKCGFSVLKIGVILMTNKAIMIHVYLLE